MPVATNVRTRGVLLAAAVGVVTGLLSTWPWELGPVVALPLWALVGVLLGMLLGGARVGAAGAAYGVSLTVAFLYSRFGGEVSDLPVYTLFVLAMCVGGALAGVLTVFLGARLRGAAR